MDRITELENGLEYLEERNKTLEKRNKFLYDMMDRQWKFNSEILEACETLKNSIKESNECNDTKLLITLQIIKDLLRDTSSN